MTVHNSWKQIMRLAVVAAVAVAGAWVAGAPFSKSADAAGMSPVEKLVAQNEIEQQIWLYAMLFDGASGRFKFLTPAQWRFCSEWPNLATCVSTSNRSATSRTTISEAR